MADEEIYIDDQEEEIKIEDSEDEEVQVPDLDNYYKGDKGTGIASVELTATNGKVKTYTITFTDDTSTTFDVTDGEDGSSPVITFVGTTIYVDGVAGPDLKGEKGNTGNGIESVILTNTNGKIKTYTITFTDQTTTTFTVVDGNDGDDGHTPVITFVGTTIYVDGVAGADLKGATGKSAYQSYLDTTADNPLLSEAVWSARQTTLISTIAAQAGAANYTLTRNKQTVITGTLPNGVNSTIILPDFVAGEMNECVVHFISNATAAPTLVYSGFTPLWLNSNAISMTTSKKYTIVFEKISDGSTTRVFATWGEYPIS